MNFGKVDGRQMTRSDTKNGHRKQLEFQAYYKTLLAVWGTPNWWPAQSRLEVIVGAYLTQNTSWNNVERALQQLRKARALRLKAIRDLTVRELEKLVRSSGYFRQKAARLKTFVSFLDRQYGGSLPRMLAQPAEKLRTELLALNGVGPETADSILLYAGQKPVFVVDAYTRRILERHRILPANAPYEEIRRFSESALRLVSGISPAGSHAAKAGAPGASHPPSRMSRAKRPPLAQVFNEMHGLIVGVGKNYCLKSKPKCEKCPLRKFLPDSK
jgi:endonuclease-3 related protein